MKTVKRIKFHPKILQIYCQPKSIQDWWAVFTSKRFTQDDICNGYYWTTDFLIIGQDHLLNLILAHCLPQDKTITICPTGNVNINYQNNALFHQLVKNIFGCSSVEILQKNKKNLFILPYDLSHWSKKENVFSIHLNNQKRLINLETYKKYEKAGQFIKIKENFSCEIIVNNIFYTTHHSLFYKTVNSIQENLGKALGVASINTDDVKIFFDKLSDDLLLMKTLLNKNS